MSAIAVTSHNLSFNLCVTLDLIRTLDAGVLGAWDFAAAALYGWQCLPLAEQHCSSRTLADRLCTVARKTTYVISLSDAGLVVRTSIVLQKCDICFGLLGSGISHMLPKIGRAHV